ncbi:MAG: hypothetical protein ABI700_12065 [Chloroflexota bacterium]
MSVTADHSSKSYGDVAIQFIQQIREHSSSAADCLEQIQVDYGTRAAYLAAYALIFLKQWQTQQRYVASSQDLHAFTYCEEMKGNAEAIQLYEDAARHLLSGSAGASQPLA